MMTRPGRTRSGLPRAAEVPPRLACLPGIRSLRSPQLRDAVRVVGSSVEPPANLGRTPDEGRAKRFAPLPPCPMPPSRTFALVGGLVFLALAGWALAAGRVLITWGRFAERPSFFYWVMVGALALIGVMNLVWAAGARAPRG